jgi:hypothetical protein
MDIHHKQLSVETRKYMFTKEIFSPESHLKTQTTMLYDTYGEEYLNFLKDLNEILSINELAELDYL